MVESARGNKVKGALSPKSQGRKRSDTPADIAPALIGSSTSIQAPRSPKRAVRQAKDGPNHRPTRRGLRQPTRKAVVVGCTYQGWHNYEEKVQSLLGAVNDAFAFALTLVNSWEFHPNEICLLTDAHAVDAYQPWRSVALDDQGLPTSPQAVPRNWHDRSQKPFEPTRANILMALNWLVADSVDGDVLVFYFAGYGIQIDDMNGWEGQGYDEAIVPYDYRRVGYGGEVNVIMVKHIREIILSTGKDIQLSFFLDATGVESALDPCGTGRPWPNHHIKGAKVKGVWPLQNVTDRVARAAYDNQLLKDRVLYDRYARARYLPGEEVNCGQPLKDAFLQKTESTFHPKYQAFQLCAAEWGTTSIECALPSIAIKGFNSRGNSVSKDHTVMTCTIPQVPVIHGVFTYCLVHAMQNCVGMAQIAKRDKAVSWNTLYEQIVSRTKALRRKTLKAIIQVPTLRLGSGSEHSDPSICNVFWPFSGRRHDIKYNTFTPTKVRRSHIPYVPQDDQWVHGLHVQNFLERVAGSRKVASQAQDISVFRPRECAKDPKKVDVKLADIKSDELENEDGVFERGYFAQKRRKGMCG